MLLIKFLQREHTMLPDPFAEIVQYLEDGLGLLGSPVIRDQERQPAGQAGGLMGGIS